jgi:hypothetical protein
MLMNTKLSTILLGGAAFAVIGAPSLRQWLYRREFGDQKTALGSLKAEAFSNGCKNISVNRACLGTDWQNSSGLLSRRSIIGSTVVQRQKRKAGRSFGVFWSGKATDQKGADLPE